MFFHTSNLKQLLSFPSVKTNEDFKDANEEPIIVNGKDVTFLHSKKYFFDGPGTLYGFKELLDHKYIVYIQEVENKLYEIPTKYKRLQFVENEKQVLVKISGYLKTIESTEVLIHENIKLDDVFLNADDKRFDDFQDFLKLLKHYTEKTIAELDKSFKLVEKLSDTDFTRKIEKRFAENESSPDHPVRFFTYLFTNQGFGEFKIDFFPRPDELGRSLINYHDAVYDEKTESFKYKVDVHGEKGLEAIEHKEIFKNFLKRELNKQFEISKKLINKYAEENSREKISNHLEININRLLNCYDRISSSDLMKKYPQNYNIIERILRGISATYKTFLSKEVTEEIQKILGKNQPVNNNEGKKLDTNTTKGIISFKWINASTPKTVVLYDELTKKGYIKEDTNPELLSKAFTGVILSEPLNIRWIKKGRNGKVNKSALYALIDTLQEKSLIEKFDGTNNTKLFQTIDMIFVDKDGNQLKNHPVSYNQSIKSNPDSMSEITKIAEALEIVSYDKSS
jgi:hypothetical protein